MKTISPSLEPFLSFIRKVLALTLKHVTIVVQEKRTPLLSQNKILSVECHNITQQKYLKKN